MPFLLLCWLQWIEDYLIEWNIIDVNHSGTLGSYHTCIYICSDWPLLDISDPELYCCVTCMTSRSYHRYLSDIPVLSSPSLFCLTVAEISHTPLILHIPLSDCHSLHPQHSDTETDSQAAGRNCSRLEGLEYATVHECLHVCDTLNYDWP